MIQQQDLEFLYSQKYFCLSKEKQILAKKIPYSSIWNESFSSQKHESLHV